jgi:hypothetical protein
MHGKSSSEALKMRGTNEETDRLAFFFVSKDSALFDISLTRRFSAVFFLISLFFSSGRPTFKVFTRFLVLWLDHSGI